MAEFKKSLSHILKNEGGYSDHSKDKGGATSLGISLRFLQSLGDYGDLDKNGIIDKKDIALVDQEFSEQTYLKYFWEPNNYGHIDNQGIATKVFDMAVNMGAGRANKLLQTACNYVVQGGALNVDGKIGAKTLTKIRTIDADFLQNLLCGVSAQYYMGISEHDASLKVFLKGWLIRAFKIYED